jgi:hypothetical protein
VRIGVVDGVFATSLSAGGVCIELVFCGGGSLQGGEFNKGLSTRVISIGDRKQYL